MIIQYIAAWSELLSLISIDNFADEKNVVIPPIKDLLSVLDLKNTSFNLDSLVTNNWRVREKIYSLICKLLISYGQRHDKWKGYDRAFELMMKYYVCGFKDSAVKVREMMIQSLAQVLQNTPMPPIKFHGKIRDYMYGNKNECLGALSPHHQKVIAMLYINREIIKYHGKKDESNQTEPYAEAFVEEVSSQVPNIQFVAFKCLAECGRYMTPGPKEKIKSKASSLLQKKNEIDPDVAAFCAAYMKGSS